MHGVIIDYAGNESQETRKPTTYSLTDRIAAITVSPDKRKSGLSHQYERTMN